MAYKIVLAIHNLTRWLIVLAGLVVVLRSVYGVVSSKTWSKTDGRFGIIFTMLLDIQLLLGLILYVFLSPLTKIAFANLQAAMSNADIRFFAIEHLLFMVVAIVLAHVGSARVKKIEESRKYRAALIFHGLAFVVILLAIPWSRSLIPMF